MAIKRPSGENLTANTRSLCFHGPSSHWPVERDQTQAVLSSDPLAIFVGSDDKSTAFTQLLCALILATLFPSSAFHTCTCPSLVPPTIHFPSRDTAMLKTVLPTSVGVPTSVPSLTRQRRIFPSLSPLTTYFPSTRNATKYIQPRPSISVIFEEEGCTSLDTGFLVSISFIISPGTYSPFHNPQLFPANILDQDIRAMEEGCAGCLLPAFHCRPAYTCLLSLCVSSHTYLISALAV